MRRLLKGIKWQVVILTFAVAFGGLFIGFQIYQNKLIPERISRDLKSVKFVKDVTIIAGDKGYDVKVKLDRVENLMETYGEIQEKIKKYPVKINLFILDNSDERLNNVYYNLQFALYEAIQKGDYLKMYDFLNRLSQENGIISRVYIDEHNVYIDLRDDIHYLYRIIPR
ncbi:hypothetical protein QTP99_09595 [Caldanaerobacter subterraneus KAk]|uniref:hypothetical protein n=1 Tax=Caldanaerobacter subterraneus TaxID=911092 RepID=UPI0032C0DE93